MRLRQQLQVAQNARIDRVASILQQPNSRLIALKSKNSKAAGTLLFTPGRRGHHLAGAIGNVFPV